jgi:hypothetical protein
MAVRKKPGKGGFVGQEHGWLNIMQCGSSIAALEVDR